MNKNTLLVLSFAIIALAAITGCGKKGDAKKSVESISFDMFNYDVIAEVADWDSIAFADDPDSRYIRMVGEGVLPRDNGDKGIRLLRDSLMKLTQMEFAGDGNPSPIPFEGSLLTDLSAANTQACGLSSNTLSASLVSPRVLVFENLFEGYECQAAHGLCIKSFINYDIENEQIISLSQLMKPGYEKQLTKLVQKAVKETDVYLMVELNEVEIPEQFAITAKGIEFIFNPYDIAPYSAGIITIDIDTDTLTEAELLNEEGVYLLTGN